MPKKQKNKKNNSSQKKRVKPIYGEKIPFDFKENANWRMFRIMAEFIEGFQFLGDFTKTVSIFGSARLPETDPDYQRAYKIAKRLGESGFTLITGGGPGIMEAANRGAFDAGAESVGLNIQLPMEQRENPYVKKGHGFHYFFTRKVMLSASSQAYLFFPGGFGTLDEFFELITLIQTNKMERIPIILVGEHFWGPLVEYMKDELLGQHQTIDADDLKMFHLTDDIDKIVSIVNASQPRKYF